MGFIKALIGLPIFVILLIFAFVNNDLAMFSLWPFSLEITVSLSVAIMFFVILGFLLGSFFSWLSYAPIRKDLRKQKKKNKKWLCPGCRDACSCAACVRKRYADPRDIPI